MAINAPLYSQQVERHAISGILRHPEIFPEIDLFLTEHDFYMSSHKTIYSVIRNILQSGQRIDKVLLASKINDLGLAFKDDINIYNYIENLFLTQITYEAAKEAAQELVNLRIRRDICETADKLKAQVLASGGKTVEEILSMAHGLYHGSISTYDIHDEPVNIFEDMEAEVEDRGNSPQNEVGLITPYPEFNRLYGGLRAGNIYAIVSRPGVGKTSFINDLCFHTSRITNFKVPALILDTEMFTADIRFRMASALTGVPLWYIESGNWRKDVEMERKVREALKLVSKFKYYHYQVGNKDIDRVVAIIRSWYFSKVGKGNEAIVAYDYIKMTGEKIGQNWAEHQVIGQKVDKIKKIGEEINASIITAMQLNRSGDSFNKKGADVTDDSTAISLSDRLQWFATNVGIFRQKTIDEITEDGVDYGTHKYINLKSRFQGKDAAGHQDLFKRPIGDSEEDFKWTRNYLNFEVKNFKVTEKGSLKTIIDDLKKKNVREVNENDKKEVEI